MALPSGKDLKELYSTVQDGDPAFVKSVEENCSRIENAEEVLRVVTNIIFAEEQGAAADVRELVVFDLLESLSTLAPASPEAARLYESFLKSAASVCNAREVVVLFVSLLDSQRSVKFATRIAVSPTSEASLSGESLQRPALPSSGACLCAFHD